MRLPTLAAAALGTVVLSLATGCSPEPQASSGTADRALRLATGPAITIGDIEPIEPAKRIRRLQPLGDLLGSRLSAHGIERGRVVVARTIEEMAGLLARGEVDLYCDSPFPVLSARRAAGGEVRLRRAAGGDFDYWSVFITPRESPIRNLGDLRGRVVALHEPHSTAGYYLPIMAMKEAGLVVQPVDGPSSIVAADRVGYFFSQDEENTVELIRTGMAAAGVISNQEFENLPPEYVGEIAQIARTDSAPRQLVLAREGLDPELLESVESILLELSDTDRQAMAAADPQFGWTWIFDRLDVETSAFIARFDASLSAEDRT